MPTELELDVTGIMEYGDDYLNTPDPGFGPRIRCRPGVRYHKVMPYSEVCDHMRVAGQLMGFELKVYWHQAQNYWACSVQLFSSHDGKPFSSPILPSEAGLYYDDWDRDDATPPQFYCYPQAPTG